MTQPDQHILAIDSATRVCDVALLSVEAGGQRCVTQQHTHTSGHAEAILPMIDALLVQAGVARNQLTAVAFGQGPGAFTGLRVACGVAQGLAYALRIPVVPVVSLHAMAQGAQGDEAWRVVVQDARMGELYVAAYQVPEQADGVWQAITAPALIAVADLPDWLAGVRDDHAVDRVLLLGDAESAYPELAAVQLPGCQIRWQDCAHAQAQHVAKLALHALAQGGGVPPAQAAPLYVRDKVAFTTAERARGQGGNPRARPLPSLHRMQAADLDAVANIERLTQRHPWTAQQLGDALQAGYEAWVIRESDGPIRGFYMLMAAPDVAHLLLIAVLPGHQRQGLGHVMLRHSELRARERGLDALLLEVRPSNQSALDFYTNRGFERIGVRKGYYPATGAETSREDAWVLKKTVRQVG